LIIAWGRVFDLRERLQFTIRVAASSLTLTTNSAGQPIWNSPNYGLITAAGQSRFLQLAGRFDF
jgi:hypothetical protein